jgi:hypothetical protein
LTSPPRITRVYIEPAGHDEYGDVSGQSEKSRGKAVSTEPDERQHILPGALDAASEVAELLFETMKYNSSHSKEPGSAEDLIVRQRLYGKVLNLVNSLPARLRFEENFIPQTCLLR